MKAIGIILLIFLILFLLSIVIYFFNLDMKLASKLIKPLTAWYDYSKSRRDKKNHNNKL